MGFWDSMKKFTQPYAEDDFDDEYDEDEGDEGFDEPQDRPARRRGPAFGAPATDREPAPAPAATGFSGQVVTMSNKQEVVLFHPTTFNDTSKAADDLRNRRAVIVNMENVDKAMARRVVDFLSVCAYAVDGKVKKVAQSTYLFCPHNMDVVGDLENLPSETDSYV